MSVVTSGLLSTMLQESGLSHQTKMHFATEFYEAFSINDGAMQFHQYRCWSSPPVDIKPHASAHMEDKSGNKTNPR
jgi:hypothetical protein